MLDRPHRQALVAVARAAGLSADRIAAMLAVADEKTVSCTGPLPLLVSQTEAARLLSVSRYTIWRLTRQGRLRAINLTPGCVRYSVKDLCCLAGSAEGGTDPEVPRATEKNVP